MNDVGERPLPQDAPPASEAARTGIGRAHGKVILIGEHTVVYGRPAIALPVPEFSVTAHVHRSGATAGDPAVGAADDAGAPRSDSQTITDLSLTATCEHLGVSAAGLEVTVDSAIPEGRGLGSSAALAGAVVRATADLHGRTLTDDEAFALVQRSESFAHGRASGVDARTALWPGGPLWFSAGECEPLPVGADAASGILVVADTGRAGSTREAVAEAGRRLEVLGAEGAALLDRAGALTETAAADLGRGDLPGLGRGMSRAQAILVELGVSSPEIDGLVAAALDADALGAKLSGGGLGGCIIALAADDAAAQRLRSALAEAGAAWTKEIRLS
ncbi:MAG: mevalonate kinase [Gordonia sp. (in: high G+C Gram-positive bacteria)]|uniref:mevalonate kinase n=1 Tax=Gordonia sp. (in: high G+C Gram-positive bacteria) TaxID=84139 RepID=UPI0039E6AED1